MLELDISTHRTNAEGKLQIAISIFFCLRVTVFVTLLYWLVSLTFQSQEATPQMPMPLPVWQETKEIAKKVRRRHEHRCIYCQKRELFCIREKQ